MSNENGKKSITLRPTPWHRELIKYHMERYGEPTMSKTIFRALEELMDIREKMKKMEKEGKKIVAVDKDIMKVVPW